MKVVISLVESVELVLRDWKHSRIIQNKTHWSTNKCIQLKKCTTRFKEREQRQGELLFSVDLQVVIYGVD